VLEQARAEKAIGSSLEAKVLLYVADGTLRQQLQALNPSSQPVNLDNGEEDRGIRRQGDKETRGQGESSLILPPSSSKLWWRQVVADVLLPFTKLPVYLGEILRDYKGLLVAAIALPLSVFPISIALAVLKAINDIPLLAPIFELIGIFASGRYLLRFISRRKAVVEELRSLTEEVGGLESLFEVSEPKTATEEPVALVQHATHNNQAQTNNGVDELRYLFITSQVELLDSPELLEGVQYSFQSDALGIGVVSVDGQKCERCWNYSVHVGESEEHPLLCERCIPALAGQF
jgi:isoleucyl-tRNA synthetase